MESLALCRTWAAMRFMLDVDHGGVIVRDQGPARPLQACPHVLGFARAHCRVPALLAAPASQASTKRIPAL